MLVASALVISMIVWMNRVARHLKKHIEERVEAYAQKSTRAGGWAIGAFVFHDGGSRRRGAGFGAARRGTFQRGRASLDRHGDRHCHCRRRGTLLLPRHAAHSSAALLQGDQRDSDGGGVPVGAHRRARTERGDVDPFQQTGNVHHRADRAQRSFLFCVDSGRCGLGGVARMVQRQAAGGRRSRESRGAPHARV